MTVALALVIPSGCELPLALVEAVAFYQPDWSMSAIWCGDPHRRPVIPAPWADIGVVEPTDAGWGRLLVGLEPRSYEWARTAATVRRLFAEDASLDTVIALWAGAVGVAGDCHPLVDNESSIVLVPRMLGDLPADSNAPREADLLDQGRYFSTIAVFRRTSEPALTWIGEHVTALSIAGPNHDSAAGMLERLAREFDVVECLDDRIGAGWWRTSNGPAVLLDLEHVDAGTPWVLNAADRRPPRTRLSEHPDLASGIRRTAEQLSPPSTSLALPGGVLVDEAMRSLMRRSLIERSADQPLPPSPFGAENSQFLAWLEEPPVRWGAQAGRYWHECYAQRLDLRMTFPSLDSADQDRFWSWAESSWRIENRSALIFPGIASGKRHVSDVSRLGNGLNVVGYHAYELSLGDVVRRITESLVEADIPHSTINHNRTGSAVIVSESQFTNEAMYATNLVVVNADQFAMLAADYDSTLLHDRRTIGYWFWELETVPAPMVDAIRFVDEIWTGSTFVARAFASVTDKPVRCVPIPVPRPQPSERTRAMFGLPDNRMIFLITFDHFSVTERKNPFSAIAAFREAFAPDEGPMLVIKTLNGHLRWQNHERVLLAASGRADIVVIDDHFSRGDQMALLSAADCLVSLHRSEGLGLHCAEAMWLGTPVIATRYSGNLDFMDDSCAVLIDATLVPVKNGEGVYPPTAMWAEPDVAQAAAWMRRFASDQTLVEGIGAAGRRRMMAQPSVTATGEAIAQAAGLISTKVGA